MKTKILKNILLVFACLFSFMSVSHAQSKPYVGVVMKSLANEFWKTVEEGVLKYAGKNKDKFKLEAIGIKNETDIDSQIKIMENFITKQVDIIALAPANSVALIPSIKRAMRAGIKVVIFDVRLDKKAAKKARISDYVFVGPDNRLGAFQVGEYMAKNFLKPNDKVIIIEGNPGAENARERKDGFMDVIKKYKLNLLASRTAHWETEEANTVMSNLLTSHSDIQAVFGANDSMVIGIEKAIRARNLQDKIKVVGFDNIAPVQRLMKDGNTVVASEDFFGKMLAVNAVKTALDIYHGKKVKGWVKTPVALVTAKEIKNK